VPTFILKSLGWLLAHAPEGLLRIAASGLGALIFICLRGRRRTILSNLDHAFPDRTSDWRAQIGREVCQRLVETAFLSLATPFLAEVRVRHILSASPELLQAFEAHRKDPAATLICSPHIAYWEAQTSMALVIPGEFPEFGIIYRPLDNAAADTWVRRSRERFGMRLLSRREGFGEALKIVRRKGLVGVLFDQNAGMQGALCTLFGRVCSTSELPGLMAEKFGARVYGIFPRRLGFWRIEIGANRIACGTDSPDVTIALNRWLEDLLTGDENLCASWLWMHDRWRHQDVPARRLRLESRRNLLAEDLAARGLPALPRRLRLSIRLPNWLGDVVMLVPLLRAIRASRPDAEVTVLGRAAFEPLLARFGVADRFRPLPPRGPGYFAHFLRLRHSFPDVHLLFTQSARADIEARLLGCRQRFGIVRPGKARPLLSHSYRVPDTFDEANHHQVRLWEDFLRHFGLEAPPDFRPAETRPVPPSGPIGLIPGSENLPAKRWPVEHWRRLIEALPKERFVVFGTENDRGIASAVAAGFGETRVVDLTGRTTLEAFAEKLSECRMLVSNDTGGMHLANALGVPIVGLFGPTNPLRTGPIFQRSQEATGVELLQPPGCPATGGGSLDALTPDSVAEVVQRQLAGC
jgi:heptosyltransferase-2